MQGVYVIENGPNGNLEIDFKSKLPMISDQWSTMVAVQELHSPVLGHGEARILIQHPSQMVEGQKLLIRGNFGFHGD